MSTSTIFYRQLIGYLRQHSRYRDLRHLKALGWMVSALVCSGQLSLAVWEPYVPSRAQKAQSTERRWQRFMSNSRIRVSRLYLPSRDDCLERVAIPSDLLGIRHHCVVGALLHDSPIGGLLWTSRAVVVACVEASQCYSRVQGVRRTATESTMAVAASPGCDALSRPGQCLLMS